MEEARQSVWAVLASCRLERPEDRRNQWVATGLLFLWAVTYVGVSWLFKNEKLAPGAASYLLAAIPVAFGMLSVLAYIRFIFRADELLRKIQLEALALGFGAGFVATYAFDLAEKAGFGRADIGSPFVAMVVFYVIGVVVSARRYA